MQFPRPWHPIRIASQSDTVNGTIVLLFFAVLCTLLFPRRLEVMARALLAEPTRAAVAGVVGLLAVPRRLLAGLLVLAVAIVVLALTIVGILAIPAALLVYGAAECALVGLAWLGCLAICLACGRAFLALLGRQNPATFWATMLGLLLAWVVFFVLFSTVEVLGGLLLATIIIFGFGLALVTGAGTRERWHPRELRGWRSRRRRVEEPASAQESAEAEAAGQQPLPAPGETATGTDNPEPPIP